MNHIWLNQAGNNRLLLFFNGWGMDANPFTHMACDNIDVLMFYDYTTLDNPLNIVDISNSYDKVSLVAWSMGIWAAATVLDGCGIDFASSVAINGTLRIISEKYGIAPNIFQGTIDSWADDSREKFYRRMCGRGEGFKFFQTHCPSRSVESQLNELKSLQSMYQATDSLADNIFTHAIVAQRDRIIPTEAQLRFWSTQNVRIIETEQSHYPFDGYNNFSELFN